MNDFELDCSCILFHIIITCFKLKLPIDAIANDLPGTEFSHLCPCVNDRLPHTLDLTKDLVKIHCTPCLDFPST